MKNLMHLMILPCLFASGLQAVEQKTKERLAKAAAVVVVAYVLYSNYQRQNIIISQLDDINSKLLTPLHLNTLGTQIKTTEEAILTDIEGVGEGINTLGSDLPGLITACVKEVLNKEKIKVIEGYPFPTPEFPPTLSTVTQQPGKAPITISTTKPK